MFLNNRYHDPATGQFISVDPLVQATGEPYIYGSSNPITYSDPSGLCPYAGCWEAFDAWLRGASEASAHVQGAGEYSPGDPLPMNHVFGHAEAQADWSYQSQGKTSLFERPALNPNAPSQPCSGRTCDVLTGLAQGLASPALLAAAVVDDPVSTAVALIDPRTYIEGAVGCVTSVYGASACARGAIWARGACGRTCSASNLSRLSGREIVVGENLRIAPLGNRTGHPTGRFPHYHRRVFDSDGNVVVGGSIKRHRPWDSRATDRSFWDRF